MMKPYLKAGLITLTSLALFLIPALPIVAKTTVFLAPPPPPAPGNDDCANATTLTVDPACTFTAGTVDLATQSIAPSTCNGSTSGSAFDVWYKFVAVPGGQTITVKGSSSFDAVVVLMDSCSSSVSDCSDNSGSGGTEVLHTDSLTVGNTYYIRIYSFGANMPTTTDFDICVAMAAPPASNDNCANAILLTVDSLCTTTPGTVAGATQSTPADSCSGFSSISAYDVWYKFVATATHSIIKIQGALSFDAVLVLKDSCNGTTINCSDNTVSGGVEMITDTNLVIGQTYYIRVYPYGSAVPSTPDFDICVSLPPPPPAFDNCVNAQLLAIDSTCNYIHGSVDGATESAPADSCGTFASPAAYDVWYKFVAGTDDVEIKVKGASSFDAVLILMDSCGGSTIDCSDITASGGTETIKTNALTPGNTYYVRVYDYGNALPETPEFEICIALPPPPPVNDNCANAITLTVDSVCNFVPASVLGATESAPADTCNEYTSESAYDVWFKFVATAPNNMVSVKGSTSFDGIIVLKDSCNGSTLDCADNTYTEGLEVIVGNGLTVGMTYYVRVYHYGATPPSTADFDICVSIPPPPVANDECSNAITLTADSSCTFITGTVFASSESAAADSCNGYFSTAAYDVWYKFVAVSNSQTIKVKGSEDFDAIVVLKDGCNGATLDCSDNTTTGGTEMIEFGGLTPGNTYYIRVYDFGGEVALTPEFEICLQSTAPAGITENKNSSVKIYPNPATNSVTIRLVSGYTNSGAIYKIMNVNGQVVTEGQFASNSMKEEVNLSLFTPGIYNIQITVDSNVINKKVVVLNK